VTRWPSRLPPPRPEMPARLRCYDPADWPDPVDWDEDAALIRHVTLGWHAMLDPVAWWANQPLEYRTRARYSTARIEWCRANGVDVIELLINDRIARRAAYLLPDDVG
jgi:hypothetical protein